MTARDLLVVVGPTACGKTRLGLETAERLGGEIVSADAFAVYRGLDIGTDKPTADARRRVRHHLIDVVDPRRRFSAGDFVAAADAAIREIRDRGRVPLVVGGTHFWVRALLLGLFPAPPSNAELRSRLGEQWRADPAAAHRRLAEADPTAAARIAPADRQRVVRALEVIELTGAALSEHWRRQPKGPRFRFLLAAPNRERPDLYARIDQRVEEMFAGGLVEEVAQLLAAGIPRTVHAFKAIGYRESIAVLDGSSDLAMAIAATKRSSRHLAKRQLSWLRNLREGQLSWIRPAEAGGAADLVALWSDHETRGGEL